MSKLLKTLIFIIISLSIILFYLFYTPSGLKQTYQVLSYGLSHKFDVKVDLKSLNIHQYPFIRATLRAEDNYDVDIKGFIDKSNINIKYILTGNCIESNICTIEDQIHIEGSLLGKKDNVSVKGEGKVLDGKTKFSFTKLEDSYEDMDLILDDINATKLLTLVGQKSVFNGKADASLHFDYITEESKKGTLSYNITDNTILGLKTDVQMAITIKDNIHRFTLNARTPELVITVDNGIYDQESEKAHALFNLDIEELQKLETLLGKSYKGSFKASGDLIYDKQLVVNGVSKSIGGETKFSYSKNIIEATLTTIPLITLANIMDTKATINGTLSGDFQYSTKSNTLTSKNLSIQLPKHSLTGNIEAYLGSEMKLKFYGIVDKYYDIIIDGSIGNDIINLAYTLQSNRFPSPKVTIVDTVNIKGDINGSIDNLHIQGKGLALEGTVHFHTTKVADTFKDVSIQLKDIRTLKLTTLMGLDIVSDGKTQIEATFNILSEERQDGNITYETHGVYETLPLHIESHIILVDSKPTFEANISLASSKITITKGEYNLDNNISTAFYTLDVPKLDTLEPLLGFKYNGGFYALGELSHDDSLHISGLSKTYGGMLDYTYEDDVLSVFLNQVSFKKFMGLFSYPLMLDATTTGALIYNFKKERLHVKTKLHHAKLLPTLFVDTVYDKSGVNLRQEVFTQSSLLATYHNGIILGDIILNNPQAHVSLASAKLDANKNTINGYFDFRLQGQEFSGKVYGSLDDPKVNLDMQKLIRYQMDKQLDATIGEGNRKLMEAMPMGSAAKDMATGVGGGFMDMFF